jgi:multidrug resistance efflux pump
MAVYTATFNAVAVTAAQDLFSIVAPSDGRVVIRELRIGQYSDFGDAQAEILPILLIRGYTVAGSVGSA